MKHANGAELQLLDWLLAGLRQRSTLREKKPGIFYRGSSAYLHFHEHEGMLYADLKFDGEFERHCVSGRARQRAFLRRVDEALSKATAGPRG